VLGWPTALTKSGKQVTVLDRTHGVDIRLGARVDCIVGQDGRASGVLTADGKILPAENTLSSSTRAVGLEAAGPQRHGGINRFAAIRM
jgi:phytoene dehydrogenase-like protein